MGGSSDTPERQNVSVDVPLLIDHPKTALLGVLKLLRNGWDKAIEDDITVEQFSGAMTNLVYRCGLLQHGKEVQVVLMRVHASSSDLFDRQAELEAFRGVSAAGLGPRLLLLFSNGRVEEFLSQHVTLAAADIHDPAVSAAIAATLAQFHVRLSKALSSSKHHQGLVQLWDRLRHWLDLTQQVASKAELAQLGMGDLDQEITQLEQQLGCQHPCWVALCHNDLQYGNIMALAAAADLIGGAGGAVAAAATDGPGAHAAAGAAGAAGSSLAHKLDSLALRQHKQQGSPAKVPAGDAASDDAASLSNVSMAGSTAPSVSGLSVLSVGGGGGGSAAAAAAAKGTGGPDRVAQLSASESGGSLQLLGRSPNRTVQLPDGSLVLPGMKARPRGQSPEPARGKRPGNADGSVTGGSSGGGARGSEAGAAIAAAAAAASRGDGGAALAVMMQRPSAAAVRRHAHGGDDAGERLLLQLGHDEAEAAADAGLMRRRRASHAAGGGDGSSSDGGGSSTSSAADSAEADDLVLPQLLTVQQRQQQQRTGASSSRVAAAVERERGPRGASVIDLVAGGAADLDAARSKTARRFQELRKARRTPAAGFEFPTLAMSDASSSDAGGGSDSSGLSDDDGSPRRRHGAGGSSRYRAGGRAAVAAAGPTRGRSPTSHSPTPAAAGGRPVPPPARGSPGKPPASAAAAAAGRASPLPRAAGGGGEAAAAEAATAGGSGPLTFIDFEYSGFNPVAFDIANHWCEWAADYHTDQPAVLDFGRLPDDAQQRAFVEAYLRALLARLGVALPPEAGAGASGGGSGGRAPAARSEAAWSALSSRGGSVLSMPDTEAAWETASQSSVVTTRSARGGLGDVDEEGGDAAELAPALSGADARPCTAQLRDVWYWLELATRPSAGSGSSGGGAGGSAGALDAAAWRRLVEALLGAARAYMAASHLQWALWGVIQSKVSDVDFDFAGYGQQRWRQYRQMRPAGGGGRK